MSDDAARHRIATSLDESLLVEAAAGTGKTTALVGRIVAVLASGRATVDRIVAVTFTTKAAGELKLRLRQELDRARQKETDTARRQALGEALSRLEEAQVGTIHSFCAELLRRRPVEARIDPAFREVDEVAAGRLFDRAFRAWLEERLDIMPEAIRRTLVRLAGRRSFDGSSPLTSLRKAALRLAEWRDHPTTWRRDPDVDRIQEIDAEIDALAEVADLAATCPDPRDPLYGSLRPVLDFTRWIRRTEAWASRDHDQIEARLESVLKSLRYDKDRKKGRRREYAPGLLRADMLERRTQTLERLENLQERLEAELVAELRTELQGALERYEALKEQNGILDFLDLILRARDLVRDVPAVRHELQERFTHYFVDELQDTDPLQLEILLLLGADDPGESDWRRVRPKPGKLFLVGDPKQSIYRFRRADVVLYRELKKQLAAKDVGVLYLSRSFRSIPAILEAVNAAFSRRMTDDDRAGQAAYVALEPSRESADQPSVVVLPPSRPIGQYGSYFARNIEQTHPQVIAGFVDWLVRESGWTVQDPRVGERVPIEPRHIAVLFRRFVSWTADATRGVQQGLEERGLPHVVVSSKSFHQREEIQSLRTALEAVEWPDDELSVFATLRGGLFAIDDALLLRYREGIGPLDPLRSQPEDLSNELRPVAAALRELAELHRRRNRVPVAATLRALLESTRATPGFALRPAGAQVLSNVQHLCDRARQFDAGGGLSFRAFVDELDTEATERQAVGGGVLDDSAEGVRILTVHAAKGLEFPVVILADPTCNEARQTAGQMHDTSKGIFAARLLGWAPRELVEGNDLEVDRDRAEAVRVAYVAATRARDLLVVPGLGCGPWERGDWLDSLDPAIYPLEGSERQAKWPPGCPKFGPMTVLDATPEHGTVIQPGLHKPRAGHHDVVWWDPAILLPRERARPGLREARVLSPDEDGSAAEAGLDAWDDWTADHESAVEQGSRASVDVRTPTGEESLPDPPPAEITVESVPDRPERPRGMRFGTLVHTLLRDVEPEVEVSDLEELAKLHGRLLDATAAEVEAAVPTVEGALTHSLFARAREAEAMYRELPFVLRLEEHDLTIEGTIDLAFRTEGGWTVVDFKTDAELSEREEDYRRQVAWYVEALRRTTGIPGRGVLLKI